MKKEFIHYLNSIGASNVVIERAVSLFEFFSKILGEEIRAIFLNDFVTQDGSVQFDTLWYFSDKYLIQAKSFLQSDNFEVSALTALIYTVEIQKQDYDFSSPTERSRLNIKITLPPSNSYSFKSSKTNCDYLKNIFFEYLRPNLFDFDRPGSVRIIQ